MAGQTVPLELPTGMTKIRIVFNVVGDVCTNCLQKALKKWVEEGAFVKSAMEG
jgi:hypothetical protein